MRSTERYLRLWPQLFGFVAALNLSVSAHAATPSALLSSILTLIAAGSLRQTAFNP